MPGLGDLSPAGAVAIGIVVGLLSTSIQSVGLTLQRKSHLLEDSKEDETIRRPPYKRRRWQIGMGMFVLSNIVGSTIQITTLPLPVLSTLQASGLVFNTLCASIVLGEPFTKWSLFGTLLVAAGAVLIAMFGAVPEPSHSLDQLLFLLGRHQFIIWMIGTFLFMLLILSTAFFLGRLHLEHSPRIRFWRGMCFGTLSGILSAHSLLVAKSAVELIVRTVVSSSNQFNRWQSWIILLLLIFFALTQLYFLHRGLKLCSTSVLYPFVFCIYNIIAILDGLIYFQQTSRLPPLHAGLIAVGTVVLLSGVLALSWRLEDDGTTPPADAHTLLTPGMGIVEDTTTESESDEFSTTFPDLESADDENTLLMSHERTPLLKTKTAPDGERLRGSVHFTKPRVRNSNNNINNWNNFHRRRRTSTSTDIEHIWSELQDDENANLISMEAKQRRASSRTTPNRYDHSYSDADDSLSPSPSRLTSRSPSPSHPLSPSSDFLSRRHLRAHTLTGTGINVHTGAGIGTHSTPTGNHSGGGLNPNASAYARHIREQRRRRRRWSSRYRSASVPGHQMKAALRAQSLGLPRPGEGGVEAGQDEEVGDRQADRSVSGWMRWLLGRSARRREDGEGGEDGEAGEGGAPTEGTMSHGQDEGSNPQPAADAIPPTHITTDDLQHIEQERGRQDHADADVDTTHISDQHHRQRHRHRRHHHHHEPASGPAGSAAPSTSKPPEK